MCRSGREGGHPVSCEHVVHATDILSSCCLCRCGIGKGFEEFDLGRVWFGLELGGKVGLPAAICQERVHQGMSERGRG